MSRIIVNHPEEFCHRCLGVNFSWHIDSDVWNAVMRPEGQEEWLWSEIICPQCFAELFEERFGLAHFELRLSPDTIGARAYLSSRPETPSPVAGREELRNGLPAHTMGDNCPVCFGQCGSNFAWDEAHGVDTSPVASKGDES